MSGLELQRLLIGNKTSIVVGVGDHGAFALFGFVIVIMIMVVFMLLVMGVFFHVGGHRIDIGVGVPDVGGSIYHFVLLHVDGYS